MGNREAQLGLELLRGGVVREEQVVEARVRGRELVAVGPVALDHQLHLPTNATKRGYQKTGILC